MMILLSIVTDITWFIFAGPHWSSSNLADGFENPVKGFGIFLSVINVFVKVGVAFLFWRTAIN
jgi:hypothetical protein